VDAALASLWTFVQYTATFTMRYFAVAGGLYWILFRGWPQAWQAYRVQAELPDTEQVRYEVRWSLINAACSGVTTVLTAYLVQAGHTSMYFSIDDYGWAWFFASVAAVILAHDSWIYWQHRAMHTDWLYRHIHHVHHRVGNPTPLATFTQHPAETLIGNVFFVLVVLYLPIHVLALSLAGAFMFGYGILGHLGYEPFPRWVTRHPLLGFLNTATYHNVHHSEQRCNYAAWFLFWDRAMGTAHASYEPTLDAIDARVRQARAARAGRLAAADGEREASAA